MTTFIIGLSKKKPKWNIQKRLLKEMFMSVKSIKRKKYVMIKYPKDVKNRKFLPSIKPKAESQSIGSSVDKSINYSSRGPALFGD